MTAKRLTLFAAIALAALTVSAPALAGHEGSIHLELASPAGEFDSRHTCRAASAAATSGPSPSSARPSDSRETP